MCIPAAELRGIQNNKLREQFCCHIQSLIRLASGYNLDEAFKIACCRRILAIDINHIDYCVLDRQSRQQALQITGFAFRYNLDSSIIQVLHVTLQTEVAGNGENSGSVAGLLDLAGEA
jgi:hypothetical protein